MPRDSQIEDQALVLAADLAEELVRLPERLREEVLVHLRDCLRDRLEQQEQAKAA